MAVQQPTMTSLMMRDAERALRDANIEPGSTLLAEKKEPGTINVGQGQQVVTNVYRLDLPKDKLLFRYEVAVFGVYPNSLIDLTKRWRSDYRTAHHRVSCCAVLKAFKAQHSSFFKDMHLYYDQARVLYSTGDLLLPVDGVDEDYTIDQVRVHTSQLDADFYNSYKLKIIQVKEGKRSLTLGGFDHVTNDAGNFDRTTEQFLDIATSQEIFDDNANYMHFSTSYYLLNPSDFGFKDDDCPYFPSNSTFLGVGMNKSIRTVERSGNTDGMSEAIVASVKKTPFHFIEFVSNKLIALLGTQFASRIKDTEWIKERLEGSLKGLFVSATHGRKNRVFEIHGLSSTNAYTEFITRDDSSQISIYDYYTQKYHIEFNYPELPLLIQKRTGASQNNLFPMEVCVILDNQRCKTGQQDGMMIRDMIRKAAIPPAELKKQNTLLKDSLRLDGSKYMDGLGMQCHKNPIEVLARVLPPPELEFGSNSKQVPKHPRCAWNDSGHYFSPAKCNKWVALALSGQQNDFISSNDWRDFVAQFCSALVTKRMTFSSPHVEHRQLSGSDLKLIIQGYYEQGYEYMLIAHPDNADQVHHAMKYIEQKTEVITQGVKITTVKNVVIRKMFQTLGNIVHKTNVKMGGLNYTISVSPQSDLRPIFGDGTLIIGIGANHPAGGLGMQHVAQQSSSGTDSDKNGNGKNGANGNGANGANGNNIEIMSRGNVPSVVGFSANIGRNSRFEFIGDFVFQAPNRNEKVGIITNIVKRCVLQFHAANGSYPTRLVIYRDGSGEGSFQKILKFEVPLIHNVFTELGITVKLTLIVLNKMQNVRLYAKNIDENAKSIDQNVLPGTVVDKDVVHPLWTEFYLNSHIALQGTAKAPRYNLLLDENNFTMDMLQTITHSLCFGHQIVYSPTSLPSPVMIALEYAKRGRNIYNYWGSSGSGGAINGNTAHDLNHLNQHLTFDKSVYLKGMRVNA